MQLAEEIATLDHISRGRVEFGIGRDTFPETHDGYNSPFAESGGRFNEYLEIILKTWTHERVSFEGVITPAKISMYDRNQCKHRIRRYGLGSLQKRPLLSLVDWDIPLLSILPGCLR